MGVPVRGSIGINLLCLEIQEVEVESLLYSGIFFSLFFEILDLPRVLIELLVQI
jgi:hypothetical protein